MPRKIRERRLRKRPVLTQEEKDLRSGNTPPSAESRLKQQLDDDAERRKGMRRRL